MKKFYVAAAFLALGISSKAQTILLSEDFQGSLSNFVVGYPSVTTTDANWYDWDEDGIADGSTAGTRPGEWFLSYAFAVTDSLTGTGDTNTVFAANSWTNDASTPVNNWLISPNVTIPAGATSAVLKWKSAPYQTPLYMDGFVVKVSSTDNDLASFGSALFTGAEYTAGASSLGSAYGSYTFSSGWIHGWDGSAIVAAEIEVNATDGSRNTGILTENQINLGSFTGQNIFFAILHTSHDDNLFSVDDISVEVVTGVNATNAITKIATYPNPTVDYVTVEYTSENGSAAAILNVTDIMGNIVATQSLGMINAGVNKIQIDATGFARGTYNVDIKTDKGLGKVSFIKN